MRLLLPVHLLRPLRVLGQAGEGPGALPGPYPALPRHHSKPTSRIALLCFFALGRTPRPRPRPARARADPVAGTSAAAPLLHPGRQRLRHAHCNRLQARVFLFPLLSSFSSHFPSYPPSTAACVRRQTACPRIRPVSAARTRTPSRAAAGLCSRPGCTRGSPTAAG